ncbi:MAG TPA: HPr family phosphocarrier protein [Terrimesophilobacter sp.]|jgi:phosphocarrier protein|nr:HPr family phosphocarrier protein [Terrimesophilobacter sp.]
MSVIIRQVAIASSVGLHARPASLFARAAADSGLAVTVTTATGKTANAASILEVLSLGVPCGAVVTLSADGMGADATLAALVELLSTDFDA